MSHGSARNGLWEPNLWKGLAAGAIGGLVGGWVMNRFQDAWAALTTDEKDSDRAHSPKQGGGVESTEQVRQAEGGEDTPATVKLATAVSEQVFDHELTRGEKRAAGPIVHYAFSAVTGAVYGAAAEVAPKAVSGAGMLFGAAVWLVADEITLPATGLSGPPADYPVSKHLYSLASHIVYGLASDAARRVIRSAL